MRIITTKCFLFFFAFFFIVHSHALAAGSAGKRAHSAITPTGKKTHGTAAHTAKRQRTTPNGVHGASSANGVKPVSIDQKWQYRFADVSKSSQQNFIAEKAAAVQEITRKNNNSIRTNFTGTPGPVPPADWNIGRPLNKVLELYAQAQKNASSKGAQSLSMLTHIKHLKQQARKQAKAGGERPKIIDAGGGVSPFLRDLNQKAHLFETFNVTGHNMAHPALNGQAAVLNSGIDHVIYGWVGRAQRGNDTVVNSLMKEQYGQVDLINDLYGTLLYSQNPAVTLAEWSQTLKKGGHFFGLVDRSPSFSYHKANIPKLNRATLPNEEIRAIIAQHQRDKLLPAQVDGKQIIGWQIEDLGGKGNIIRARLSDGNITGRWKLVQGMVHEKQSRFGSLAQQDQLKRIFKKNGYELNFTPTEILNDSTTKLHVGTQYPMTLVTVRRTGDVLPRDAKGSQLKRDVSSLGQPTLVQPKGLGNPWGNSPDAVKMVEYK